MIVVWRDILGAGVQRRGWSGVDVEAKRIVP